MSNKPQVTDKPSAEMIESAIRSKHESIASIKTPKQHKERRPDGFDYVTEAYMRHQLNMHYPVWSWNIIDTEWLGSEWIMVRGELTIIDQGIPRKFASIGATRIQFKKGLEHTPENVVDVDKNVATANTNAFKRAVNRLCDIANDVYKKAIEDLTLTDNQIEDLNNLVSELDNSKIKEQVDNGIKEQTINKTNYDASYDKLLKMKKGDSDDKS